MIEVCLENRETGATVYYNVNAYGASGADFDGPVFWFELLSGGTATFHKSEWICHVREWRELK